MLGSPHPGVGGWGDPALGGSDKSRSIVHAAPLADFTMVGYVRIEPKGSPASVPCGTSAMVNISVRKESHSLDFIAQRLHLAPNRRNRDLRPLSCIEMLTIVLVPLRSMERDLNAFILPLVTHPTPTSGAMQHTILMYSLSPISASWMRGEPAVVMILVCDTTKKDINRSGTSGQGKFNPSQLDAISHIPNNCPLVSQDSEGLILVWGIQLKVSKK